MPERPTIVVLEGDQTGQELLEQALRVLEPEVCGLDLELRRFDLSLASRRATSNAVVQEAAAAMREAGYGIKAATVTPEGADDVGSPNRLLREAVGGKVIIRTGRRIPGITPIAGVHHPISIVRMAVDDAYGAKESREGEPGSDDEIAFRTERISRSVCRAVAEYAFRQARDMGGRVYGGPKWTVSPVYEGMLKEDRGLTGGADGDGSTITIRVYSGSSISGTLVKTISASRLSGNWYIVESDPLPGGTYTARAAQSDAAGNTGYSAA